MTHHRFRTTTRRNTTAAGYGAAHQTERRRRLTITHPTDPCGYCGKPLGPNQRTWALPHNPQRTGYEPGMWHIACNNREAAIRGNQKQRARRTTMRAQSRTW